MSEFLFCLHILLASFCSRTHIFGFQVKGYHARAYSLFMRRIFCAPPCVDMARHCRPNWTEHLLIYRIPSHTNPKRRDFSLKQPGQKSAKEEGPEQRKGPKRAVNGSLKVQTYVWEHDVGCSSHLTPTRKSRRGNPRRDFFYGILPVQPRRHSSSPGKSRPHLTWPSPKTAVRAMRLVWSVL